MLIVQALLLFIIKMFSVVISAGGNKPVFEKIKICGTFSCLISSDMFAVHVTRVNDVTNVMLLVTTTSFT